MLWSWSTFQKQHSAKVSLDSPSNLQEIHCQQEFRQHAESLNHLGKKKYQN